MAGFRQVWLRRHGALLAVLVVMVFAVVVRLRLADVPLERDEGEYAYAGQLILEGTPPYALAYNMKFPGTYYAYSAILALFGQTPFGIRLGLLLLNGATTLVVFFIARRLMGALGAAVAAGTFAVLALDRFTNGIFAHATHFVLLPALGSLLLLLRAFESRGTGAVFGAGLLAGLAVLMKQHAVFYLPCIGGLLLVSDALAPPRESRKVTARSLALVLGMLLPFAILCAVLAAQGVLGRFWFWTFDYARKYVSERPITEIGGRLMVGWNNLTHVSLFIWVLAVAGIPAVWLLRWPMRTRVVLTIWLVASFLATCPGYYFRPHYFILVLPSVGLFTGVLADSILRTARRGIGTGLAGVLAILPSLIVVGSYIRTDRAYLFEASPTQVSRMIYARNPFVEAPEIARYIRERTTPADRIAVLGNEPEILFYAHRRSATGYLYVYPLMEPQPFASRMQREMIQEIEAARPAYLVFVGAWSWNATLDSDTTIFTWADRYIGQCYDRVGLIDLYSLVTPAWLWDDAVSGYRPQSERLIETYRRRAGCGAG
jgi:4-amino-4-deoxy-L-arabinose transferase-like glycosyltransferase